MHSPAVRCITAGRAPGTGGPPANRMKYRRDQLLRNGMSPNPAHSGFRHKLLQSSSVYSLGDFTKTGAGEGPLDSGWPCPRFVQHSESMPEISQNQLFDMIAENCNGADAKGQGRAQAPIGGFQRCP